jgi:hypothetical protein
MQRILISDCLLRDTRDRILSRSKAIILRDETLLPIFGGKNKGGDSLLLGDGNPLMFCRLIESSNYSKKIISRFLPLPLVLGVRWTISRNYLVTTWQQGWNKRRFLIIVALLREKKDMPISLSEQSDSVECIRIHRSQWRAVLA